MSDQQSDRGAPPGNKRAQIGPEPLDGQLPLRLPRAMITAAKAVTYITGDRGLNAFARRLMASEIDRITGAKILACLQHAEAVSILRDAGHECPAIPSGENTAELWFRTADGHFALAVNQSGFARTASDNEEEVNGCMVLVVDGDVNEDEARRLIDRALHQMTEST